MPEPLVLQTKSKRLDRIGAHGLDAVSCMPFLQSIVLETAQILRVEIALVGIVLEHEQIFVATHGLNAKRGPRGSGICAHALVQPDGAMVIPDTKYDARTMDSPLVLTAPHIRSYAGRALLLEPDVAIGTLCACGLKPRNFSAQDIRNLDRLAERALEEISAFLQRAPV